jgi:hypothetical protein
MPGVNDGPAARMTPDSAARRPVARRAARGAAGRPAATSSAVPYHWSSGRVGCRAAPGTWMAGTAASAAARIARASPSRPTPAAAAAACV